MNQPPFALAQGPTPGARPAARRAGPPQARAGQPPARQQRAGRPRSAQARG